MQPQQAVALNQAPSQPQWNQQPNQQQMQGQPQAERMPIRQPGPGQAPGGMAPMQQQGARFMHSQGNPNVYQQPGQQLQRFTQWNQQPNQRMSSPRYTMAQGPSQGVVPGLGADPSDMLLYQQPNDAFGPPGGAVQGGQSQQNNPQQQNQQQMNPSDQLTNLVENL